MIGSSLVLELAACSGGGPEGCNPTTREAGGTVAAIVNLVPDPGTKGRYTPASVGVKVGDAVTWKFDDWALQHTVTADDGSFESCKKAGGDNFTVGFTQARTYKYHCRIHPAMRGEVKVR